eukprot:s7184_g1.t2
MLMSSSSTASPNQDQQDGRSKQPEKAAKVAPNKQEEEAATKIQALFAETEVMVEALLIQSGAVSDIPLKQAIHRGNLARKDGRSKQPDQATKESQSKQEEEAATKIQAIHRGNLARKATALRETFDRPAPVRGFSCSVVVGTRNDVKFRSRLVMCKQPEKAAKEAPSKQEEEAATKIQAIHRGNLARKDGRSKQPDQATKEEREKVAQALWALASSVFAIHRGNLARKDGRGSKKQNAAEGEERAARSSKGSRSLRASIVDMAGPKHSAERASRTRRRAETAKSSRSGSAGHSPRRSRSSQGSESDRSPSAGGNGQACGSCSHTRPLEMNQ